MFLFGIEEQPALAFGQRVTVMFRERDLESWGELFDALSCLHPRPELTHDGRLLVDKHPRTDFEWHMSPKPNRPALARTSVPEKGSELSWLLACALLQSCDLRVELYTASIGYVFTDDIRDCGLARTPREMATIEAIASTVFDGEPGFPAQLPFLAEALPGGGYLSTGRVASLAADAAASNALGNIARQFKESGDVELGDDIGRLYEFLRLAAASNLAIVVGQGGA